MRYRFRASVVERTSCVRPVLCLRRIFQDFQMKLGMMDEPAFNIKFVEIVKRYPCLYDFTRADYSKREANEHAWNIVSVEMKMTVPQCKEKWRNLRTALARSMKLKKLNKDDNTPHTDASYKPKKNKQYYLKEAMNFILPFLRSKGPGESLLALDSSGNEIPYDLSNESGDFKYDQNPSQDHSQMDADRYEPNHYEDCSPAEYASSSAHNPRKRAYESSQDDHFPDVYEFPSNPARLTTRTESDDANKLLGDCFEYMTAAAAQDNNPDLQFLKSLLPDISKMGDHQKRQFKMRTLEVINSILCGPSSQNIVSL